jgi:hypothetical protein
MPDHMRWTVRISMGVDRTIQLLIGPQSQSCPFSRYAVQPPPTKGLYISLSRLFGRHHPSHTRS